MKKSSRQTLIRVGLVLLLAIVISIPLIITPMANSESDAYSRSPTFIHQTTKNLFAHMRGGTWLPFHQVLLISSLYIYNNYLVSPRVITLIISLGSVLAIYFYAQIFTKNKNTALLASLIFTFLPLRLILSVETLSEPVFTFFLIATLILIFKKKPNYYLGILVLNIAHGIRYETWLILPFIWLAFILDKKITVKKKMFLLLLSISFPIFWMYQNARYCDGFLDFFFKKYQIAQRRHIPRFGNFNLSFLSWWQQLKKIFPWPLLITTIIGIYTIWKNKPSWKQKILAILPFYLFFLLIIQVYLGTMEWNPVRYLLIPVSLIIPLSVLGLSFLSAKSKPAVILIFLSLLFLYPSLLSLTYKKTREYTPLLLIVNQAQQVIDYLRPIKFQSVLYFFPKDESYQNVRIGYFSKKELIYQPISLLSSYLANDQLTPLVVIEKANKQENYFLPSSYQTVLENPSFVVFYNPYQSFH